MCGKVTISYVTNIALSRFAPSPVLPHSPLYESGQNFPLEKNAATSFLSSTLVSVFAGFQLTSLDTKLNYSA